MLTNVQKSVTNEKKRATPTAALNPETNTMKKRNMRRTKIHNLK